MKNIILYDGNCGLCAHSVQFLKKRSAPNTFIFSPLQSEAARELLNHYQLPLDMDTMVFIEQDQAYTRSTATLRACRHLRKPWPWAYPAAIWVPKALRDRLYRLVARNRHKLFKAPDTCSLE